MDEPPTKLLKFVNASCIGIRDVKPMDREKMDMIHLGLCTEIGKLKVKGTGPRFLEFSRKCDWIMIVCENSDSEKWLRKTIYTLKLWEGADLSIIDAAHIPYAKIGTIIIPYTEARSVESAFKMLSVQNYGLRTDLWNVVMQKPDGNDIFVKFTVDPISSVVLRITKGRVALGFTKVIIEMNAHDVPTAAIADPMPSHGVPTCSSINNVD